MVFTQIIYPACVCLSVCLSATTRRKSTEETNSFREFRARATTNTSDILILVPGSDDRRLHRSGTPLKELTHRYSRVVFNLASPYRHLEQCSYSRSLKLRMSSKEKSQPKLAAHFVESQSITANAFCPTSLVWPLGIWQMLSIKVLI